MLNSTAPDVFVFKREKSWSSLFSLNQAQNDDHLFSSGQSHNDEHVFSLHQSRNEDRAPLPNVSFNSSRQIREPIAFPLLREHSLNKQNSNAFEAAHFIDYLLNADPGNVYTSLEPLDTEYRKLRSTVFTAKTKERFGMLLDTGAPMSCVGKRWVDRFVSVFHIDDQTSYEAFESALSGIGKGSAIVKFNVTLPIGIC
jgi:hypothetical protein